MPSQATRSGRTSVRRCEAEGSATIDDDQVMNDGIVICNIAVEGVRILADRLQNSC
jgi:hypothetical protein